MPAGRKACHWPKPDGMPLKCMDVSRMEALGIRPQVGLAEGVRRTIDEYREIKRRGRAGTPA